MPTKPYAGARRPDGLRRLRAALAVIPVATVAWLAVGAGIALAGPSGHAASNAATPNPNANGGVGNGSGAGNAKHGSAGTSTGSTGSDTSAGSSGADATPDTTTGPTPSPQPQSNADQNSGGANGQCPGGPYCSTRDGSPSGNGNGNGKATGKPCAGCVGKADNKNPKGQMPGGSDHNKGYECDGNHGIGKSNPAHTGCVDPTTTPTPTPTPDPTPTCPDGQTMVNGVCQPQTQACPDGEHLQGGTCVPDPGCVPSVANNNCSPTPPVTCPAGAHAGADGTCVLGEKHTRKPPTTTVLGDKVTHLPFTGANVSWMVKGGIAAVATGGVMLAAAGRRRRRTAR